jgi:hypothetical protein
VRLEHPGGGPGRQRGGGGEPGRLGRLHRRRRRLGWRRPGPGRRGGLGDLDGRGLGRRLAGGLRRERVGYAGGEERREGLHRLRRGGGGRGHRVGLRGQELVAAGHHLLAAGLGEPGAGPRGVAGLEERQPQVAHGLLVVGVEIEGDLELAHRVVQAARLEAGQAEVDARPRLHRVVVHQPLPGDRRLLELPLAVEGLAELAEHLGVARAQREGPLQVLARLDHLAAPQELGPAGEVEDELLVEPLDLVTHGHRPALSAW